MIGKYGKYMKRFKMGIADRGYCIRHIAKSWSSLALEPMANDAIMAYMVKITHPSDAVMTMNLFLKVVWYLAGFTIL